MGAPDIIRRFCFHLAGQQQLSLHPGIAWGSVGSRLTDMPPTGDAFDSSSALMKWTLSAWREFVYGLLAGDSVPAGHMLYFMDILDEHVLNSEYVHRWCRTSKCETNGGKFRDQQILFTVIL